MFQCLIIWSRAVLGSHASGDMLLTGTKIRAWLLRYWYFTHLVQFTYLLVWPLYPWYYLNLAWSEYLASLPNFSLNRASSDFSLPGDNYCQSSSLYSSLKHETAGIGAILKHLNLELKSNINLYLDLDFTILLANKNWLLQLF